MKRRFSLILALLALALLIIPAALLLASAAHAKDIPLQWDASPSANVTGYIIYYGPEAPPSGVTRPHATWAFPYSATVTDGLTATIPGLPPGEWFFAATAFNEVGQSEYGNIVQATVESFVPPSMPHEPITIPLPAGNVTININFPQGNL